MKFKAIKHLMAFLRLGGRNNAKSDFFKLLAKAANESKVEQCF